MGFTSTIGSELLKAGAYRNTRDRQTGGGSGNYATFRADKMLNYPGKWGRGQEYPSAGDSFIAKKAPSWLAWIHGEERDVRGLLTRYRWFWQRRQRSR
jgi:hypothetical protein